METTTTNPALKPEEAETIREQMTEQYQETRQQARDYTAKGMKMIRRNPSQSALAGLGIGFLLAQLPLRFIAAGIVRLFLASLRPAALLYAIYKLGQEFGMLPRAEAQAPAGAQQPEMAR